MIVDLGLPRGTHGEYWGKGASRAVRGYLFFFSFFFFSLPTIANGSVAVVTFSSRDVVLGVTSQKQ